MTDTPKSDEVWIKNYTIRRIIREEGVQVFVLRKQNYRKSDAEPGVVLQAGMWVHCWLFDADVLSGYIVLGKSSNRRHETVLDCF